MRSGSLRAGDADRRALGLRGSVRSGAVPGRRAGPVSFPRAGQPSATRPSGERIIAPSARGPFSATRATPSRPSM